MQTKQLRKIIQQHLLSAFDGFAVSDRAEMLLLPMNHLFRGFVFYGDFNSTSSFYVESVILPLYVPSDGMHLLFGKRLRNGMQDAWEWDPANESLTIKSLKHVMKSQGIQNLQQVRGPLDLARLGSTLASLQSLKVQEAIAYSLIYSEVFDEACSKMDDLCAKIRSEISQNSPPWAIEWRNRSEALQGILLNNPHEAKAKLEEWEKQTITNLKLEFPN